MSDPNNPTLIDGFTSVQALRHSGRTSSGPRTRPSSSKLPERNRPNGEQAGKHASHIGHTVVPKRFDIVCYECGYGFVVQGRLYKVYCPKCRTMLETETRTIEGNWSGRLRTIGTVTVASGAVLRTGSILAGEVILSGDAGGARLTVTRRLVLCAGAHIEMELVEARDFVIRPDACLALDGELVCQTLEVAGDLRARVSATGLVTIRPGGLLRGELSGPRLVVDEGGGLRARVSVGPQHKAPRQTQDKKSEPVRRTAHKTGSRTRATKRARLTAN